VEAEETERWKEKSSTQTTGREEYAAGKTETDGTEKAEGSIGMSGKTWPREDAAKTTSVVAVTTTKVVHH